MLKRYVPSLLLVICCALWSIACADNREPVARDHLRQQIESESGGALVLTSMLKTNGYEHDREGMKLYTLEWDANVIVDKGGWKAGWRDYSILPVQPNALAAAVEGVTVKSLLKGTTAVLQGKSELQKADRGWRVLSSGVTAVKLIPPPPGTEFIGDWTGYYAPDPRSSFEATPLRRMSIAREGDRFKITYTENDGRQYSWLGTYQTGRLVDVEGPDELTGTARTLEASPDGTLREFEEGVVRYTSDR
jgi:hypothetical protein